MKDVYATEQGSISPGHMVHLKNDRKANQRFGWTPAKRRRLNDAY
jgi:hypothetical protein